MSFDDKGSNKQQRNVLKLEKVNFSQIKYGG
jgi:hypothetical protein